MIMVTDKFGERWMIRPEDIVEVREDAKKGEFVLKRDQVANHDPLNVARTPEDIILNEDGFGALRGFLCGAQDEYVREMADRLTEELDPDDAAQEEERAVTEHVHRLRRLYRQELDHRPPSPPVGVADASKLYSTLERVIRAQASESDQGAGL